MEKGVFGRSMRLGYNSLGAHASLNHLHFQGFFIDTEDNWQPPLEEELKESIHIHDNNIHCFRNTLYNVGVWFPYSEQKDFGQFLREIKKRGQALQSVLYA